MPTGFQHRWLQCFAWDKIKKSGFDLQQQCCQSLKGMCDILASKLNIWGRYWANYSSYYYYCLNFHQYCELGLGGITVSWGFLKIARVSLCFTVMKINRLYMKACMDRQLPSWRPNTKLMQCDLVCKCTFLDVWYRGGFERGDNALYEIKTR